MGYIRFVTFFILLNFFEIYAIYIYIYILCVQKNRFEFRGRRPLNPDDQPCSQRFFTLIQNKNFRFFNAYVTNVRKPQKLLF